MAGLKSKALDRVRDDVPVNLIKPETQSTEKRGAAGFGLILRCHQKPAPSGEPRRCAAIARCPN